MVFCDGASCFYTLKFQMIALQVQKLCTGCTARVAKCHFTALSSVFPVFRSRDFSTGLEQKVVQPDREREDLRTRPQYHLSNTDRLTLKWFGNIKGEIPSEVSYAVMEKAESKRRIAVNLFLVAFCGFGSMFVVYNVKKNLSNETQDNIYDQNKKRYQQASQEK